MSLERLSKDIILSVLVINNMRVDKQFLNKIILRKYILKIKLELSLSLVVRITIYMVPISEKIENFHQKSGLITTRAIIIFQIPFPSFD